ncbi:probable glutamate--tRNA ligase, mitochondrial [Cephus cinctus]|uniref:Nondiscriminating glutamyl-tRNA synthetase EARS2, mitochondrial n=1 Tax=Cephus cinctus TaxID=211228 RepID=A0AAJ7C0K5_CEPCN|nr:probable glutamate--tRNA ligase, mitochondrial [Cephus cinctus]
MQRSAFRIVNFQLSQKRYYRKHNVRVRFAPSPTGHLHLGGLRTALYNYLFARANDGCFILRIEDTDQTRIIPDAMQKLQDDLFWAGIIPDEDPIRGGPTGPYIQSKRIELYKEQVLTLLNNESAYYCFCSEHRLDLIRKDAMRLKQKPKYDNRCRYLTKEEVKNRIRKGEQHCIRFKLTSNPDPFVDLVYGEIAYDVAQNEGDPIIIKSDGYPTYHFANVVDDHFMEISHVLRGIEWQISTQKHLLLYKAFGWIPPRFGHLPLILNPDGTKLSKRQGDITVEAYRKQGIFPLALLNFITHAGGGFSREQGGQRCYSYEELIKQFDITKINVNSTKLSPEKLLEFNKMEISQLLANDDNCKFLVQRVSKLVLETFPDRVKDGSLQLNEDHILSVLKWAQHRISKLSDLVSSDLAFLWVVPSAQETHSPQPKDIQLLRTLSEKLSSFDEGNFQKNSLKNCLKEFADNNEIPFPTLMNLLRSTLSGLKSGPGVAEMMEIMGKETTLNRLKQSIS